jgi:hypothetical protein
VPSSPIFPVTPLRLKCFKLDKFKFLPSYPGKCHFALSYEDFDGDSDGDSYRDLYACRRYIILSYGDLDHHPICSKSYGDSYEKSYTCRRPLTRFCKSQRLHPFIVTIMASLIFMILAVTTRAIFFAMFTC